MITINFKYVTKLRTKTFHSTLECLDMDEAIELIEKFNEWCCYAGYMVTQCYIIQDRDLEDKK